MWFWCCSYANGLSKLETLPQLRQVDIKRFSHFGPQETEQLLEVPPIAGSGPVACFGNPSWPKCLLRQASASSCALSASPAALPAPDTAHTNKDQHAAGEGD